jgi:ligand-binding sensor domain-containing protein
MYRHITEDDGLPDNEIYYLYLDKKGVIWISTNNGLCRYNGKAFQVSAVDYLLKPLQIEQLIKAVEKAEKIRGSSLIKERLETLKANLEEQKIKK